MRLNDDSPPSVAVVSRRGFLRALGALAVGTSLIAACGPQQSGGSTQPAAAPTTAGGAATTAPAQATPGNLGNKQIAIEWWRRNYTPGSQTAETITSDAAVKGLRDRYPMYSPGRCRQRSVRRNDFAAQILP